MNTGEYNIKIIKANTPVWVSKFPNHSNIKDSIILSIDNFNSSEVTIPDVGHSISKTDWMLSPLVVRDYFEIVESYWKEYLSIVYNTLGYAKYSIDNFWFQQYSKGDNHPWHGHSSTNLSSVYYVELPDMSTETEFIDPYTRRIIKYQVSEGDVITFPAMMIHRSPTNDTSFRKTVIIVNSSGTDVSTSLDKKYINTN